MKKTIATLMAASTLAAAVLPVLANETINSSFVDNYTNHVGTELTVEDHNAFVAAQDAAAKKAAEEAALKAGIATSEYVESNAATTTPAAPGTETYGYKLEDGTVLHLPVDENKNVVLPSDAYVARHEAANAAAPAPAEKTVTTPAPAAKPAAETAPAAKKAHASVAAAKTAVGQKALPKTSAASK